MNTDKTLRHGKICPAWKTEPKRPPSMGQAVLSNQWESEESDTKSLDQERAQQQQLYHDRNKYILPQKKNADSLQQTDGEDEDANDDVQVNDNIEVASNIHGKENHTLLQTEYLDTQIAKGEGCLLLSDDPYSDLRYDPNWRTNLQGNCHFNENPQISVMDYYQVPEEKFSQSDGNRLGLEIKGGYRYFSDTCPAVMVTPHKAGNECDQPYRLHPQDGQTSSVTSLCCHNQAVERKSPEANVSTSSRISTKTESENTVMRGSRENCENSCDSAGENIWRSPKPTEVIPATEFQTYYQQEPSCTQGVSIQKMSTSTITCPKVLSNKKLEKQIEDIVERNKITLGRSISKCGSYVRKHSLKKEMRHNVNEVYETRKETAAEENPEDSSDPELRWIQITQELWQKGQDAIISLASLHGRPQWSPAPEVPLALSPGYRQTNPGKSSQMSQEGLNAQIHQQNLKNSPEQWQRKASLKWPLSHEGEEETWSSKKVNTKQFPPKLPRTPTAAASQGLRLYTTLPPIGKPVTGKEPKLNPGQCVNSAYPIHRSSSDSYLAQMEKQKQLRARVTYKGYKQLKTDMNLQDLHPDYPAIEKTKMKRQKLYSNVIREQNKKISRIPFLPAKDPEGNAKKVPRMKALEYAKIIAKPPVQSQPKQRRKYPSDGFTEYAPYLQGLDVSQLIKLELLRKRHEEEKQAVAVLRKVHAF